MSTPCAPRPGTCKIICVCLCVRVCVCVCADRAACYGYSQGAPGKLYDWRNPAVRDYWTEKVIAPYVNNENISGIFMDDTTDVADRCFHPPHGMAPCHGSWTVTAEQQLEFMDATMQHLEQALTSMDVQNKTAIVSTEGTYVRQWMTHPLRIWLTRGNW